MPGGPLLLNHPTKDWPAYIESNGVAKATWYCRIPGVLPCGFSTQDKTGGESPGDRIEMDDQFWEPAKRAYARIKTGERMPLISYVAVWRWLKDLAALECYGHEFFHCYVRLDAQGNDLPEDDELYSHPGTAKEGIRHAFRRRLPVNAFTRLLRWRKVPENAWKDFLVWFGEQVTARQQP